ncbi:outer membrane protein assembly factor BamA [Aliiroseovarius sp.]|uniref:outer membrane protein assembly factor BamA n=1 Tax=Aliiroseovarius sp. TaxID=1872442 RepID=UPI00262F42B3|nr:outer membrane protein assembly factor BamA [Aliiroseovarius sp.]
MLKNSGINAGIAGGTLRFATRSALALFLATTAVTSLPPQPAAAQTYAFTRVEIEGNRRIEAATILSYLGVERGETLSAAELNDGYRRLQGSGLFERVALVPQGNLLVVRVQEFPTINRVSIEGNRRLKDEVFDSLLQSAPRQVYSPSAAEADARTIIEAYQSQGRIAATVDPVIIRRSNNRVDLVFEVSEGRTVEVERLTFTGNRDFSDRRLRRVLETKQAGILRQFIRADTYVPDRIEFDKQVLRDFYQSRGYIDFQVTAVASEMARERDAFFVTFQVREGQSFEFGEITTTSDLAEVDPDEFHAVSRIRPGQTYNPAALENTIARMERLAIQKGLNFIRVEPRVTRNDRSQTLDIELVVTRGPRIIVERIDIEGNATTLDRVVRNQFRVVEGDPFNPREIREAAERIRALGFFSTADVQAREGSGPGTVVIDVDVEEQPTGSLSFGGSYSSESGLGLNLAFTERNFLGRGQYLSLSFNSGSDTRSFNFGFVEPNTLGRDLAFGIRASYADSDNADDEDYDTAVVRFRPSLEFPVSENGRLKLSTFVESIEMTGAGLDPADVSTLIIDDIALGRQTGAGVGVSYTWDTRRTGLNPEAGVRANVALDLGGFGADYEYAEATASLTGRTLVLNDQITLRGTVEGGALIGLGDTGSRIVDRFSLGTSKMRGFEPNGIGPRDLTLDSGGDPKDDALGGNFYAVTRLEAEFPLGLPEEYGITGGLFVDAGTLWGLDDNLGGLIDDAAHIRAVVGASVFWTTAIGPLRFNFTHALAKEDYDKETSFEFTIQTEF